MVTPTNSNFPPKSPVKLPMTKVEPNSKVEKSQPQLSCLGPPCQRPSLSCLYPELLVPALSLYCMVGVQLTCAGVAPLAGSKSQLGSDGKGKEPLYTFRSQSERDKPEARESLLARPRGVTTSKTTIASFPTLIRSPCS